MFNVKGIAMNEKGNVKAAARKAIADYVAENRDVFAKAEAVKNGYVAEFVDEDGNVVYVNFEVSVSNKSIADRAEKVHKAKAPVAENFDIEA